MVRPHNEILQNLLTPKTCFAPGVWYQPCLVTRLYGMGVASTYIIWVGSFPLFYTTGFFGMEGLVWSCTVWWFGWFFENLVILVEIFLFHWKFEVET
jgi:hypothetical protein